MNESCRGRQPPAQRATFSEHIRKLLSGLVSSMPVDAATTTRETASKQSTESNKRCFVVEIDCVAQSSQFLNIACGQCHSLRQPRQ
jgi:hypothetical protein